MAPRLSGEREVRTSVAGTDLQKSNCFVKTVIEWNAPACNVQVLGSWNNFSEWMTLQKTSQTHSLVLQLVPGLHWLYFFVDGNFCRHPGLGWQNDKEGNTINFLHVDVPGITNETAGIPKQHFEESLVSITWSKGGESVLVEGSWDSWKLRKPMMKAGKDHYLLLSLPPGKYPFRFIVDGVRKLDKNVEIEHDSNGIESCNILFVKDDGIQECILDDGEVLLDDFLGLPKNEVSTAFSFNVGSVLGSIHIEEKMYPCTSVGYMISSGFMLSAKQVHMKGFSWGGCFKKTVMTVLDGRHCRIKKKATRPLTRINILLDNYQMKQNLLLRFKKGEGLPPYFAHLFWLLDNPPKDFDTNFLSRVKYLEKLYNHPSLAPPPRRMLALISVAQFYKSLSKTEKSAFNITFNELLQDYADWQKTVHKDSLLEKIYMDGRIMKRDSRRCPKEPVANSGLEMSNFLRVFFVHSPDYTLDANNLQLLRTYVEIDLIIAYYFAKAVATLLILVRENMHRHPLLKAAWDFYCSDAPLNQI